MLSILDFIVRLIFRRKVTLPNQSLLPPGVEIREATWFLKLLGSKSKIIIGMTIANTILVPRGPLTMRLLMHELTHVRQWHRYGLRFPFMWIWELLKYGSDHDNHGLEGEAEEEERKYPAALLVRVK